MIKDPKSLESYDVFKTQWNLSEQDWEMVQITQWSLNPPGQLPDDIDIGPSWYQHWCHAPHSAAASLWLTLLWLSRSALKSPGAEPAPSVDNKLKAFHRGSSKDWEASESCHILSWSSFWFPTEVISWWVKRLEQANHLAPRVRVKRGKYTIVLYWELIRSKAKPAEIGSGLKWNWNQSETSAAGRMRRTMGLISRGDRVTIVPVRKSEDLSHRKNQIKIITEAAWSRGAEVST